MKGERCLAETRRGQRCSAQAVDGLRCAWHSTAPEWVEKRRRWSAEDGRQRSNRARVVKRLPPAMTAVELEGVLGQVLRDVVAGRLEPGLANAAANVGRALAAVKDTVRREEEVAELRRLAGLDDRSA